jgi:hypothetical protein
MKNEEEHHAETQRREERGKQMKRGGHAQLSCSHLPFFHFSLFFSASPRLCVMNFREVLIKEGLG